MWGFNRSGDLILLLAGDLRRASEGQIGDTAIVAGSIVCSSARRRIPRAERSLKSGTRPYALLKYQECPDEEEAFWAAMLLIERSNRFNTLPPPLGRQVIRTHNAFNQFFRFFV